MSVVYLVVTVAMFKWLFDECRAAALVTMFRKAQRDRARGGL